MACNVQVIFHGHTLCDYKGWHWYLLGKLLNIIILEQLISDSHNLTTKPRVSR